MSSHSRLSQTKITFFAAILFAASSFVTSQPFVVTPTAFAPDLGEPAKRRQNKYEGLTFDFNTVAATGTTPNGAIQANQVATNPFLSTLGDAGGQTLITLGPCASNTPHTHPRGTEMAFMLYGEIEFGMVEENGGANQLLMRTIKQNTTISIPQGLLHFSFNNRCEPAAFLASFGSTDPGTQTMWASLFAVPTHILHAASGLPEKTINDIKKRDLLVVPATGGEACMKRCGLDFKKANKFTRGSLSLW